ncbi:nucleoside-diphosphate-sugar epimerase [Actinokineospora baliensis]|uniref:NAD-dependent epimerase/dehydratase family protein n=1 Tax=Actinokineospora baliensis TaxID=547056 RepID=UPI001957F03D|nr:NAD(P)-dependent oxidoreductase [Actinokineospora baliensis]MBM7773204.1 nucleoside-diphosphate-sugar epimerase [Actinokineospora baliensis]
MRVFAVGATGVLGRHLVPELVRRGHEVVVMSPGARLDRLPPGVGRVRADLLDPGITDRLTEALTGVDVVVNAATAIPRDFTAPGAWDRNTNLRVEGTARLMRAVVAADVPAVVQMSVTMAYADGGDHWLTETAPFDQDPARASIVAPVAAMEQAVRDIGGDQVAWTILRGARFVGAGTTQDTIRERIRAGTAHPHPNDGYVSLVHTADFATATAAAVERGLRGAVLNIADEPLLVADYLRGLADHEGARAPGTSTEAVREISHRVSSEAAHEQLAWRPEHGIWPRHSELRCP